MGKIDSITDREVAFILLKNACGKCIANRNSYPEDIFLIAYDYLFHGCESRVDYEYLISYMIEDPEIKEELLK